MEDQEMPVLRKENHREVEAHKISKAIGVLPTIRSFSCDPVCRFLKQAKHKSEFERRSKSARKLCGLNIFCLIFIVVEIVGGVKANSLAVLTDAAHLLTDVAGFCISLFALWASGWDATPNYSFGFFRLEVLGALFSVQLIWLIAGILIYEAIDRILNRNVIVNGKLMFVTAAFGFFINLIMVTWLGHDHIHHACGSRDHCHGGDGADPINGEKTNFISSPPFEHQCETENQLQNQIKPNWMLFPLKEPRETHVNMNLQGAYLHVLGDLIQSIGVMIGGAVIWAKPDWLVVDLFCTVGFSALVLFTSISMLRNIFTILMESTPKGIDIAALEMDLKQIGGVQTVHDLHVWAMSVGKVLLSCHVSAEPAANSNEILLKTRDYCEKYGIHHVTVQIEQE